MESVVIIKWCIGLIFVLLFIKCIVDFKNKHELENTISQYKSDLKSHVNESKKLENRIVKLESDLRARNKEKVLAEISPQIEEIEKLSGLTAYCDFSKQVEYTREIEFGHVYRDYKTVHLDFPSIRLVGIGTVCSTYGYPLETLHSREQLTNYLNALKVEECEKKHKKKKSKGGK